MKEIAKNTRYTNETLALVHIITTEKEHFFVPPKSSIRFKGETKKLDFSLGFNADILNTIDLFEAPQLLPPAVQKLLNNVEDGASYPELEKLLKQLEKHGYTFDYYLDATPYNLRQIVPTF